MTISRKTQGGGYSRKPSYRARLGSLAGRIFKSRRCLCVFFCALFWGGICLTASAAWVSVSGDISNTNTVQFTMTCNRRPGIYLSSFKLDVTGVLKRTDVKDSSNNGYIGLWSVPHNVAASASDGKSQQLNTYHNAAYGTSKTIARNITAQAPGCFSACSSRTADNLNASPKYWYRIYPGDGSVTASNASGALGGAKTVTFSTPTACSWPTYYAGTNANNGVKYGSLWPDILVSYSTSGTPADPTYASNNGVFTYSATGAANANKTTATLNLAANQTYTVKVRLAVDNGYSDRSDVEYGKVSTFTYDTYSRTAPTASPVAGTYTGMRQVALSGAQGRGENIRYTLDGSDPTTSSPVYSTPIVVNKNMTIKARIFNTGVYPAGSGVYPVSPVATYTYTINYSALTASPAAGTYTGAQNIALGNGDGMDIRYTLDGTEPTAASSLYTGAIPIDSSCTIKARRYIGTTAYGSTTTFPYTINYAPASASPAAGTYYHTQTVTLTPSVSGGELYYTLDGSVPSKSNGTKYEEPIQITENTKIRVQQYRGDAARGGVADFDYIIQLPGVKADPAAGMILKGSDITLSLAASDAQHTDVFYTLDVNQPREKWAAANFPIRVDEACTIYAVAQDKASKRDGEVCEFAYTVTDTGYVLNELAFWNGSSKVTSPNLSALAGKTVTAKANITKITPAIQGWLVTALYDPSGCAEAIKLDKLDQISGVSRGDAVGKPILLPADTTGYMLKTFIVHDFAQLRPVGAVVQIGEREEEIQN